MDANSRNLMQLFIEQLSDYALIALDADGRVLTWNVGAHAILGEGASDDIVGRHISEFYSTEDVAAALDDAVTWGRHEVIGHVVGQHGAEFEVHGLLRPVCDRQNRLLGFGMLARNVDSAKRLTASKANTAANAAVCGQGKMLVVDDDEAIRTEIREKLESFGYQVVEASNGPEAIGLLADTPDIDLLFTDVVMPGGMNGRQVAEQARRVRPDLKVLFTSGYNEEALVQSGKIESNSTLVVKPYRMNELTRKMHALLETTS
jgi:PAS domain S-box-containing protein